MLSRRAVNHRSGGNRAHSLRCGGFGSRQFAHYRRFGMAMPAMIKMIATTMRSSSSEKPACLEWLCVGRREFVGLSMIIHLCVAVVAFHGKCPARAPRSLSRRLNPGYCKAVRAWQAVSVAATTAPVGVKADHTRFVRAECTLTGLTNRHRNRAHRERTARYRQTAAPPGAASLYPLLGTQQTGPGQSSKPAAAGRRLRKPPVRSEFGQRGGVTGAPRRGVRHFCRHD